MYPGASWRRRQAEAHDQRTHEDSQTLAPSKYLDRRGALCISTQQSAGRGTPGARYPFPHPRPGRRVWWGTSRKGPKRLQSALDPFGLGQEQGSLSCVCTKNFFPARRERSMGLVVAPPWSFVSNGWTLLA